MDFRSLINKIAEAEAPLPGTGQKGPTVAAAAGQDPSNPLNKASGQAAQPDTVAAEWKPTPEQEKWLGGADRQDPHIMSRMPGDKPPVSYFKDPADQATAKQLGFPAEQKSASGQGAQPAQQKTTVQQKIEKLNQLVDKLVALRNKPVDQQPFQTALPQSGQAAQPGKAPNAPLKVDQNADGTFTSYKKDGSKVTFDKDGKILSESIIAKDLVESFGYQINEAELSMKQIGGAAASGVTKAGLAKAGASSLAKIVPGAGTTLSAMDAYNRWKEGDRTGAVIAALAGAGWLIPGWGGWIAGGGLDALNMYRDSTKDSTEKDTAQAQQSKTSDPKVLALQKFLKSQGADLGTTGPNKDGLDGVMGPKTRAAMDQLELTEAQRSRLSSMLAEAAPPLGTLFAQASKTPGLGDVIRTGGKTFRRAFAGSDQFLTPAGKLISQDKLAQMLGKTDVPAAAKAVSNTAKSVGSKIMPTLGKVGGMIKKHPYAAGALGATGLAAYGLSGDGTAPAASTPTKPTTSTSTPTSGQSDQPAKAWSDEEKELNRQIKDLIQDLGVTSANDPAVNKAFQEISKKLDGINAGTGQAAQPAKSVEQPASAPSLSDWASKIGTYK